MKRSQSPLLIAFGAILAILVIINELGRKPDEPPSEPPLVQRAYSNPALGFALELPDGWTFSDSLAADGAALRASLEIVQIATGERVNLRASATPWEYFVPLAEPRTEFRDSALIGGRQGWSVPAAGRMTYTYCDGQAAVLELLGPKILLDSVIAGLRWTDPDSARAAVTYQRPAALPERVKRWSQACQSLDLTPFGTLLADGKRTYLYVGSGQRPTGGYRCTVSAIVRAGNERLAVFAEFARPRFGEVVSQAYSYPNDVIVIDGTGYSAEFFGTGDDAPPFVSQLAGIDSLPPIFDQSRTIKVFLPAPNATADSAVHVSGIVHGTVDRLYSRVLDSTEVVIEARSQTFQISPHWLVFSDTLALAPSAAPGTAIHLELYTIDDASGDIVDQIRIPLRVKKR